MINSGLYTHQNGMYGLQHDIHHQSLLPGIETLPSLLRRAGHATALVGKKHVGPDSAFPYEAELVPERSGIRDVRELAIAASSFIRSTDDRPFFVTIAYSDPHRAAVDYGNDRPWPGVKRPATIRAKCPFRPICPICRPSEPTWRNIMSPSAAWTAGSAWSWTILPRPAAPTIRW
nr:sulfatase-like hydrolase/transferase [Sphingobium fuliginis]